MRYNYFAIVIGAGSAGLTAAAGLAGLGAKVALIEANKMGGDCLNVGCVPSKAFLKVAHLASDIYEATNLGLNATFAPVDLAKIMSRVKKVINAIAPHDSTERFKNLGVNVFQGKASLLDKHTVLVGEQKITAKFLVIATGSTAAIPPIPGLQDVPYLTNQNIFDLTTLPKHLIVLGGGSIGAELGQGFKHLGSDVSIIDMIPRFFSKDEPEVTTVMENKFITEGIKLYLGTQIKEIKKTSNSICVITEKNGQIEELCGDRILVALGRKPETDELGLEKIGISLNKGYVVTNKMLQTNITNIYACGDVVGPYQFTHMANYQATTVVKNLLSPIKSQVNYSLVPWVTYTKPEVAHVGYTEEYAKAIDIFGSTSIVPLIEIDRALTDEDDSGFLKLIINKKGRVCGATLVSNKAGEIINIATLTIKQNLKPTAFTKVIFPYPTISDVFHTAGIIELKKHFKPWMKQLLKLNFFF